MFDTKVLNELLNKDFETMKAKDFEDLIVSLFKNENTKIERQVFVNNRYDGRRGRIDLVITTEKEKIAIEIDRKTARNKSLFKLRQIEVDRRFIFLRSPFSFMELTQ